MKIFKKISMLLLATITFVSCDEAERILDELTEFNITQDLTREFNVSISEEGPETLNDEVTFDLASINQIQDDLDLISHVVINSLTFEIDNFTGDSEATLSAASMTFGETSISLDNINLEESDIEDTEYPIGDPTQLNAIADELQEATQITVALSGTVDNTPVSFDVKLVLNSTISGDVL